MTLLVLRPEPGASRTVAAARAIGLEARATPLFETVALGWAPPDPARFEAIMFTSANAPRLGGPALAGYRGLRAYAVGAATAEAAREAGFDDVRAGAGDVAALVGELAADGIRRALHLCGEDRRGFAVRDIHVEQLPIYAARVIARPRLGEVTGMTALLHSPRAAARFAALVPPTGRHTTALAAISPTAAAQAGDGWRAVAVATVPTDAELLAIAAGLCEKRDAEQEAADGK